MVISRLCIDSNILIELGWPKLSDDLDYLFSVARAVSVRVFLPELVEIETEAEWCRRFTKKKNEVGKSLSALADHTSAFTRPTLEMPTIDSARARYATEATAAKAQWRLETCPTTGRSLRDLLRMAAFHELPFRDSDSSFRDAVILISIIDYLDHEDPTEVILISKDAFFTESRIIQ